MGVLASDERMAKDVMACLDGVGLDDPIEEDTCNVGVEDLWTHREYVACGRRVVRAWGGERKRPYKEATGRGVLSGRVHGGA